MNIQAYGSLERYLDGELEQTTQPAETTVRMLIRSMDIPEERVKLVMVNHKPALPDDTILNSDRVALFPQEYPFFADWKDYWEK